MEIKDRKKPVRIFCCYARKDQPLLMELKSHLKLWERQQLITLWADTDISPGSNWQKEIFHYLDSAHIILLLVSSNFLASEYCYGTEMMRIMKRYERGEVCVIPVILRSCVWEEAPFGKFQVLPTGAKPIESAAWHTQDEALVNVVRGLRVVIEKLHSQDGDADQETQPSTLQRLKEPPRSLNQAMTLPDAGARLLPVNVSHPSMSVISITHSGLIKSIIRSTRLLVCSITLVVYWLLIGYMTPSIFPEKILNISDSTPLIMSLRGNDHKTEPFKVFIILCSLIVDWFFAGMILSRILLLNFFSLPYAVISTIFSAFLLVIFLFLLAFYVYLNFIRRWKYINVINIRKILVVTLVTGLLTLLSQFLGASFLYFPILASAVALCLFFYNLISLGGTPYSDGPKRFNKRLEQRYQKHLKNEWENEAYHKNGEKRNIS